MVQANVYWGKASRRGIDVNRITHAIADDDFVRFYPAGLAFVHADAAEILWQWRTSPWQKFCTYAINKANKNYLSDQIKTILEAI